VSMQEPGEWYEYRLRDSSDTLSFRASPRPDPESQVSFVVYGDMGESDHARAKAPGYILMRFCFVRTLQGMCLSMLLSCCNVAMLAVVQSHIPRKIWDGRTANMATLPLFLFSTHLSKVLVVKTNCSIDQPLYLIKL